MKGCARTCLLWLLGWGAAAFAFHHYFIRIRDFGPPMYWAAAVAGLAVVLTFGYAWGIVAAYRERKMLVEAVAGTTLPDGKWIAISGPIHSMAPLTAPLSGRDSVAYEYKISRSERVGRSSSDVPYFEGKALTPSTIATRQGTVRLLAVPSFQDVEPENVPPSQALANAREYVMLTEFRMRSEDKNAVDEESMDDDGQYRRDRRHSASDVALTEEFRYEEKRIGQGEQVCAFGLYSRQRGGFVPHPNWAHQMRLMRGDAAAVAAKLRTRMIRYFAGVLLCSGAAYGIVRLYEWRAVVSP
ncbi:MAG TPA: hypothetical protein VND45_02240 [Thermoanaerobaculia bacterium]|jgi:hypothetical protein|nr:hypothetical protein [Thermoanaerobaculia bacterium]